MQNGHPEEAEALLHRVEAPGAGAHPLGGVLARSERLLSRRLLQQTGQRTDARNEYIAAIGDRRSRSVPSTV